MQKTIRYIVTLFIVCFIAASSLAFVYIYTKPKIEYWKALNTELAVKAVLPDASEIKENALGETVYYLGLKNNQQIGLAIQVAPKGYSAPIQMLVGVSPRGSVSGVEILEQLETPGLGANIVTKNFKGSKKPFVAQFIGKTINDPIKAKQDIDALTGATISSNAVCTGVKEALKINKEIKP